MRGYRIHRFDLDALKFESLDQPRPRPGEIVLDVKALSLNYRDLLVIKGQYNPNLNLPAVPISDGAGVVSAIGDGVTEVNVGDGVATHFISGWLDGPFRAEYGATSLGTPGPGLAAEQVALPARAVVPIPKGYSFAEAATLPIAALTAWSALVTEGHIQSGQTVLTLGTGGVSIFALQLAKTFGAKIIITSGHDEKLRRAADLGADHGVNYRSTPDWEKSVLELTVGVGVDITVETGGAGTLDHSMKATRAGGTVAVLGALTGLKAEISTSLILMKRLHLAGIYVDSRACFLDLIRHIETHRLKPIIDRTFPFDQLPAALRYLESGAHFGKVVVDVEGNTESSN